ncbi:MAG TPA: glucokinase [Pseudolabrys sp.]|nr:glucokinase [Pseudolabrys sp.]
MNAAPVGLVADIGATNARFALAEAGAIARPRVFATDDFVGLAEAIEGYLAAEKPPRPPTSAVLAVAAPVTGDEITLTNFPWTFSVAATRRRFGFVNLRVVNDFVANALAIPHLGEADRLQIGGGAPVAGGPIGVLGPGSGLGVSILVTVEGEVMSLQGEGGHVTMAAADDREAAVLELMRARFDHVSAERVLSGPGLINLYNALCELAGEPAAPLTAAQITNAGIEHDYPRAREATAMFCAMLGTVAGNVALTVGARGGIYIAGGIVPKLGRAFVQSAFRARFEAKGRFSDYLAAIPTYVITHPEPALLGAAKLLAQMGA